MAFFYLPDNLLCINGEFVPRDSLRPGIYPPDVQRNDEDSDDSDTEEIIVEEILGEISESENEDDKDAFPKLSQKLLPKQFIQTSHPASKTPMSEENDTSSENRWKGKEKEREMSLTPEPEDQHQAQGPGRTDFLHLILGTVGKMYSNPSYLASHAEYGWNPAADYGYSEIEDFRWPMPLWDRSRIFASHSVRRPQPEFVTGPSRITLDDL